MKLFLFFNIIAFADSLFSTGICSCDSKLDIRLHLHLIII